MRTTLRQELGKGMELARQNSATLTEKAGGGSTQYAVVCIPRMRYNITKVEVYSTVATAAGANTLDVGTQQAGSAVPAIAQFDPDTIVAGAAPVAKTLLDGAGYQSRGIDGGTPVVVALTAAAGSAAAPPDVTVVVHWEPDIRGYDGDLPIGTYE